MEEKKKSNCKCEIEKESKYKFSRVDLNQQKQKTNKNKTLDVTFMNYLSNITCMGAGLGRNLDESDRENKINKQGRVVSMFLMNQMRQHSR